MPAGKKFGGRARGTPNKSTASVKAALIEAFDQLGGIKALVEWGKTDRAEFYKLWAKILPQQTEITGKDGGDFIVKVLGAGVSMDDI